MNIGMKVSILRILVGYIGEKHQKFWWGSNFFSRASESFLLPIYPRTTLLAQYNGVCEAALLSHDQHIGVGNTYHLYRLPNSIERIVAEHIQTQDNNMALKNSLSGQDAALAALGELTQVSTEKVEGPVAVGMFQDDALESLLNEAAARYLKAFQQNYQCFPYMRQV